MSDRLKELQRQRALIAEQLAWVDREIAAVSSTVAASEPAPLAVERPAFAPISSPVQVSGDQAALDAAAEEILAQYKKEGPTPEGSVKRGCFLYFFIALALLGAGVFALYLFRSRT